MKLHTFRDNLVRQLQAKGVVYPDAVAIVHKEWIAVNRAHRDGATPKKTASELLKTATK